MCLGAAFYIFQKLPLVLLEYIVERDPSAISYICLTLVQLTRLLKIICFHVLVYCKLSELNLLLISKSLCFSKGNCGSIFQDWDCLCRWQEIITSVHHYTKPQFTVNAI